MDRRETFLSTLPASERAKLLAQARDAGVAVGHSGIGDPQLARERERRHQLEAQVSSLQAALADHEAAAQELRGSRDVLRQQLLRQDERGSRMAASLQALEQENAALSGKLVAADRDRAQMQAKIEAMQARVTELQQSYVGLASACDDGYGLDARDILRRSRLGGLVRGAAAAGLAEAAEDAASAAAVAAAERPAGPSKANSTIAALTRERDALSQRVAELSGRLAEAVGREGAARGAQALRTTAWKRSAVQAESKLAAALKRVKELSEELKRKEADAKQRDKYTAQLERTLMAQHKTLQQQRRAMLGAGAGAGAAASAGGGAGAGAASEPAAGASQAAVSQTSGPLVPSQAPATASPHAASSAPGGALPLGPGVSGAGFQAAAAYNGSRAFQTPTDSGSSPPRQPWGGAGLALGPGGPQTGSGLGLGLGGMRLAWPPETQDAGRGGAAPAAWPAAPGMWGARGPTTADVWRAGSPEPRHQPQQQPEPQGLRSPSPSASPERGVSPGRDSASPSLTQSPLSRSPSPPPGRSPSPPPAVIHAQLTSVEASLAQLYRELEEFKIQTAPYANGAYGIGGGVAEGGQGGFGGPAVPSLHEPYASAAGAGPGAVGGGGGCGGSSVGENRADFAFPPSPPPRGPRAGSLPRAGLASRDGSAYGAGGRDAASAAGSGWRDWQSSRASGSPPEERGRQHSGGSGAGDDRDAPSPRWGSAERRGSVSAGHPTAQDAGADAPRAPSSMSGRSSASQQQPRQQQQQRQQHVGGGVAGSTRSRASSLSQGPYEEEPRGGTRWGVGPTDRPYADAYPEAEAEEHDAAREQGYPASDGGAEEAGDAGEGDEGVEAGHAPDQEPPLEEAELEQPRQPLPTHMLGHLLRCAHGHGPCPSHSHPHPQSARHHPSGQRSRSRSPQPQPHAAAPGPRPSGRVSSSSGGSHSQHRSRHLPGARSPQVGSPAPSTAAGTVAPGSSVAARAESLDRILRSSPAASSGAPPSSATAKRAQRAASASVAAGQGQSPRLASAAAGRGRSSSVTGAAGPAAAGPGVMLGRDGKVAGSRASHATSPRADCPAPQAPAPSGTPATPGRGRGGGPPSPAALSPISTLLAQLGLEEGHQGKQPAHATTAGRRSAATPSPTASVPSRALHRPGTALSDDVYGAPDQCHPPNYAHAQARSRGAPHAQQHHAPGGIGEDQGQGPVPSQRPGSGLKRRSQGDAGEGADGRRKTRGPGSSSGGSSAPGSDGGTGSDGRGSRPAASAPAGAGSSAAASDLGPTGSIRHGPPTARPTLSGWLGASGSVGPGPGAPQAAAALQRLRQHRMLQQRTGPAPAYTSASASIAASQASEGQSSQNQRSQRGEQRAEEPQARLRESAPQQAWGWEGEQDDARDTDGALDADRGADGVGAGFDELACQDGEMLVIQLRGSLQLSPSRLLSAAASTAASANVRSAAWSSSRAYDSGTAADAYGIDQEALTLRLELGDSGDTHSQLSDRHHRNSHGQCQGGRASHAAAASDVTPQALEPPPALQGENSLRAMREAMRSSGGLAAGGGAPASVAASSKTAASAGTALTPPTSSYNIPSDMASYGTTSYVNAASYGPASYARSAGVAAGQAGIGSTPAEPDRAGAGSRGPVLEGGFGAPGSTARSNASDPAGQAAGGGISRGGAGTAGAAGPAPGSVGASRTNSRPASMAAAHPLMELLGQAAADLQALNVVLGPVVGQAGVTSSAGSC